MTDTNRRWLLATRPVGAVKDSDFTLDSGPVPQPGDGEFLVRVTHLSFDPTQRGWLGGDTYLPAVKIGDPVRAGAIGQVIASNHPKFKVGQLVQGTFGWQEYVVSNGMTETGPVAIVHAGVTPEQALGVFGITGLTAYFGLTDLGKPQPGDTVLVSGAAGATGSVVVQVAKALGCKVIGIAGGASKCAFVTDVAGADACIDYRSGSLHEQLKAACPDRIDIYFDNVGGEILDVCLGLLAQKARVVICGAISQYNATEGMTGPANYMSLLVNRARMEGFVVFDYQKQFLGAIMEMAGWMMSGQLKFKEHVVDGIESFPQAFDMLFAGTNFGKLVIKV